VAPSLAGELDAVAARWADAAVDDTDRIPVAERRAAG
jgi:hypothetical protein